MTDKINKYAEFMTKQVKEGSFGYPSKSGKQGVGVDARGPVEDAAVSLDEAKKVPAAKTERTSEAAKNLPESEEVKFSDYVAWIAESNPAYGLNLPKDEDGETVNPWHKLPKPEAKKDRDAKAKMIAANEKREKRRKAGE